MDNRQNRVREVIGLFLRLGLTAFGGPAAHIAMMHDEVVTRRKWVDEQRFLDLLGAANLIPGPTSTEMAIYLGMQRIGWLGLLLGGLCFILPAMLIVLALAWAYVRVGSTPAAVGIFYGIKPVVIAVIAQALWGLGRKGIKGWLGAVIAVGVVGLYLVGANVLILLLAAGVILMLARNARRLRRLGSAPGVWLGLWPRLWSGLWPGLRPSMTGMSAAAAAPFTYPLLFLTFLKIGAVLYGSGYVLLAFLRADFVNHLGWLTDRQLIDAVAIGQVTPGPVFTTATFIGYLLGGVPGALLATLAIFLPSFFFVAGSSFLLPHVRSSALASAFLEGVTVASLGLMLGVTLQLALSALVDPLTVVILLIALLLLFRYKVNTTWLIAGGALAGLAHMFVQ